MNSALAITAGLLLVVGLIWALVHFSTRWAITKERKRRLDAEQKAAALVHEVQARPAPPNRNERGARWRKLRNSDASDTQLP